MNNITLDTDVCITDGYTQSIGQWDCAKQVRHVGFRNAFERECVQNLGTKNEVQASDFSPINIAYSWGGSSEKAVFNGSWEVGEAKGYTCELWIGVAIVPDEAKGQWHGRVWHKPTNCRQAINFCVVDALPVSEPMIDKSAIWFDYDDPDLLTKILARKPTPNADGTYEPCFPSINVNVTKMVAGLDPVSMHTHICNMPWILEFIPKMLLAFVEAA